MAKIHTENGKLSLETGLLEGKKVTHTSVSTPKNEGKSNETSSKEQAILEGLSKIKLKLREGYFTSEKEALEGIVIKPMLANSYSDHKSKVTFPCWIQPKLDGVRSLKEKSSFKSRKNTVINTVTHIEKELDNLNFILDGELYCHGSSFQENMKLIKKKRKETVNVKYYVYDIISDKPFEERYSILEKAVVSGNCEHIILVPTIKVNSEKEFKLHHDKFVKLGYEGAMIRHGKDGYKINGRSSSLLKFKEFLDRAYPIIDITPARKNPLHGVPVVKITDKTIPLTTPGIEWYKVNGAIETVKINGVDCGYPTSRCGAKITHEDRVDLLKNKSSYIGKTAEIRFFEFHDTGVPRFPIFHGIRIDK